MNRFTITAMRQFARKSKQERATNGADSMGIFTRVGAGLGASAGVGTSGGMSVGLPSPPRANLREKINKSMRQTMQIQWAFAHMRV